MCWWNVCFPGAIWSEPWTVGPTHSLWVAPTRSRRHSVGRKADTVECVAMTLLAPLSKPSPFDKEPHVSQLRYASDAQASFVSSANRQPMHGRTSERQLTSPLEPRPT